MPFSRWLRAWYTFFLGGPTIPAFNCSITISLEPCFCMIFLTSLRRIGWDIDTRFLNALRHRSMLLFVRGRSCWTRLKTFQHRIGNRGWRRLLRRAAPIQVVSKHSLYSRRICTSSLVNAATKSSKRCVTSWGGTNASAWKHFMRRACSASSVNHPCRERAWILRKLHWPKWKRQPRISAWGKLEEIALYAAISKSVVTVSGAIPGRCCSNKRKIRLYTTSDLFSVTAYTNGECDFGWAMRASYTTDNQVGQR